MPTFHYIARGADGESSAGSLDAHTAIDAMNQLRRRGLRVERLKNQDDPPELPEPITESVSQPDSAVLDPDAASADAANVSLGVEELAEIAGRIAGITK